MKSIASKLKSIESKLKSIESKLKSIEIYHGFDYTLFRVCHFNFFYIKDSPKIVWAGALTLIKTEHYSTYIDIDIGMPWVGFCTFGWLKPKPSRLIAGLPHFFTGIERHDRQIDASCRCEKNYWHWSSPKSWDTKMAMKHGWGNNQEVNRLHNSSNFWIFHCQVSQVWFSDNWYLTSRKSSDNDRVFIFD